jgi:pyruvate-ferredoxin/flavodoxin oxidoreductase
MDQNQAKNALKQAIQKAYGLKGDKIVNQNYAAVEAGFNDEKLMLVDYPSSWAEAKEPEKASEQKEEPKTEFDKFMQTLFKPVREFRGNELPVSAFDSIRGGQTPTGTTKFEKRGVAQNIPVWFKDHCIRCNICSFVCPQAAIRPILMNEEETKKAVELGMDYLPGNKQTRGYNYKIQVSPLDCLDCGVCVQECKKGALKMTSIKELDVEQETKKWDYSMSLPERGDEFKTTNIVGSQFQTPLLEFTGACNGCAEATYMKVLTQLFGDRMMLANAAGCSIVWCGTFPSAAYTVNKKGHGPSWGFSLFEDNAEYGFGMAIAAGQKRQMLKTIVERIMKKNVLPSEQKALFQDWLDNFNKGKESKRISLKINEWMEGEGKELCQKDEDLREAYEVRDMFTKPSVWIIGGDGFAYDIGSGGLDHVLSMNIDINVLVMDNQSYANTGFQMSKSTPFGTKAKFAFAGKRTQKKDLGMTMMQYGHVYVAQIASGADMTQTLRALHEAEEHPGPSLVIAYCPCQGQGLVRGMSHAQQEMRDAVESGFWPIYRYDPKKPKPLQIDNRKITKPLSELLKNEVRFVGLERQDPELAKELFAELDRQVKENFEKLLKMEQMQ